MMRMREERGMAMIVAMMAAFVVLLLSTAVVAQAIHSGNESAYDRSRLQSIDAAEAGLNYFYNYLQHTQANSLNCSPSPVTLATAPTTATFTATATLYDSTNATLSCPPPTEGETVASALVTSVGKVNGNAARTMQAYMKLTPRYGAFGAAIISNTALTLAQNLTLNGNAATNADVYVNSGNFTASNSPNIYGTVYVPAGNATLGGIVSIRGNLWANGSLAMSSNSTIYGNVQSSTSSVTVSTPAHVNGNAQAGTTITGTANIDGTKNATSPAGAPPSQPLPPLTWVQSDWTNAGYTIQSFSDCASAKTYILGNPTGNNLVRINAVCALDFGNNTSVSLNGNLAIFTDGSITMTNSVSWTGTAATSKLFFIDAYRTGLSCAGGAYDVGDSNNVSYVNANIFWYSPCAVNINNRSNMTGQIFGQTVNINNQFTMNFKPVLVPGLNGIKGYTQDISYIREVAS